MSYIEPELVDVLTLGHQELYNDFIYIWLIQYVTDPQKPDDWVLFKKLVDSVIRFHPKMESLYLMSCYAFFGDFQRPEECQPVIMAGMKVLPESWRLPMTQGFVSAFFLQQPVQAAAYFDMASSRQGSPNYLNSLVKKLLSQADLSEQDIQRTFETVTDSRAGSQFLKKLMESRKARGQDQTQDKTLNEEPGDEENGSSAAPAQETNNSSKDANWSDHDNRL